MRTVSYGKQLEFLHCMDAFTQESRPLVDFLCRKVRENPRYSYYGSMRYLLPANEKELELEGKTLDEFADLWETGNYRWNIRRVRLSPGWRRSCRIRV